MTDSPEPPEDVDQAVNHLQTYFESKKPDMLAEHLLEDLEVVKEKLEDCSNDG